MNWLTGLLGEGRGPWDDQDYPIGRETMTNAERQHRYIERLKSDAGSSNTGTDETSSQARRPFAEARAAFTPRK
jgi:hypothetical protein